MIREWCPVILENRRVILEESEVILEESRVILECPESGRPHYFRVAISVPVTDAPPCTAQRPSRVPS
jgi:hypothetical protein